MLKHQLIQKKANHQRQKDRKGKSYFRAIILTYLFFSGTLLQVFPALAASPTPGNVIDNQATGSFIDFTDNTEKQVESNIVKVTVAEVAGITITPANTPSPTTGSTANFDFTVTNVGNDPTQFFIPDAPSAISRGTVGTLQIVAYDPDGSGPAAAVDLTANNITIPNGGENTGTLLGAIASANNGSIPVGASIVVRVPVTVTAIAGQTVSVTLGNTGGQPSNSNTPYILGANGTGSKDLYTVDNADNISGESAGAPINGDATNHRQEASAILTAVLVASNPNVLLVKRITAINDNTTTVGGDSLIGYVDAPSNAYDDNNITIPTQPTPTDPPKDTDKWPPLNSFMLGGINGGKVKPSDEIEYTIYFLSTGDGTANNTLICDRIPDSITFLPTAFNSFATKNSSGLSGGDRGIIWQYKGNTQSLTNTKDGDAAQYFPPGVEPSTVYNDPNNPSKKVVDCGGTNTNGAIVVNLGDLPNATGSGTPATSYGFIRFRGWVK